MRSHRSDRLVILLLLPVFVAAATAGPPAEKEKEDRPAAVNSLGMKLVLIRKGDFQMGSEEFPSERPPRPARINKDFYLAIHHVTVGQFQSFVKDTGHKTDAEKDGKGAEGFDRTLRGCEKIDGGSLS